MATAEVLRLPSFGPGNSLRSYSAAHPASPLRVVEDEMQRSVLNSQYIRRVQTLEILIEQMTRLLKLEQGWDSYGAMPPNKWALGAALRFLISGGATDLLPARVLASAEGGVALRFVFEEKRALIEFLNSETIELMLYDEAGTLHPEVEETLDEGKILRALKAHLTR